MLREAHRVLGQDQTANWNEEYIQMKLSSKTVQILSLQTDWSEQTEDTKFILLLQEQCDQDLLCLQFCLHLDKALIYGSFPFCSNSKVILINLSFIKILGFVSEICCCYAGVLLQFLPISGLFVTLSLILATLLLGKPTRQFSSTSVHYYTILLMTALFESAEG